MPGSRIWSSHYDETFSCQSLDLLNLVYFLKQDILNANIQPFPQSKLIFQISYLSIFKFSLSLRHSSLAFFSRQFLRI